MLPQNNNDGSVYHYKVVKNDTAFGDVHYFIGPKLSRYDYAHLMQPFNEWAKEQWDESSSHLNAQRIVSCLNAAYEAGRESMAEDIKNLLNIK